MESSDWMTGKTPVTVLNELAAAAKIQTPAFECVGTSDGVFIMRTAVSIYGLSAEGRGRTKQNAKHSAAQALLLLIVANSEVREKLDFLPDVSSEKASELVRALWSGGDGDGGGGVGEEVKKTPIQLLGEFVTKQGWNLAPSYSGESQRENSDGTKTFVVKASLGKFSAEGEGKRIKEAKQAAAKALLHKFEDGQGLLSPFPNSEADEDPDGAYATKDVPGTQDIQKLDTTSLSSRLGRLNRSAGAVERLEELYGLDWTGLEEDEDCQRVLIRLCEGGKNFTSESPSFLLLPQPSAKGEIQALACVTFTDGRECLVTTGAGLDEGRAVSAAAASMLRCLVIAQEPLPPPPPQDEDSDLNRLQIHSALKPHGSTPNETDSSK